MEPIYSMFSSIGFTGLIVGAFFVCASCTPANERVGAGENSNLIQPLQIFEEVAESQSSWEILRDIDEWSIKVNYPAGSIDPFTNKNILNIRAGINEVFRLQNPLECATFEYSVFVPEEFDFVRGGKLPGLGGGKGNTGGHIPDGTDGFSSRIIWKEAGEGAVYSYLPTSKTWGTAFGNGAWKLQRNKWTHLKQMIKLNHPNAADGSITLHVNGTKSVHVTKLLFRNTTDLKIDKLLISSFFGGNSSRFSPSKDEFLIFKDFKLTGCTDG
jgi:hypothetical protein